MLLDCPAWVAYDAGGMLPAMSDSSQMRAIQSVCPSDEGGCPRSSCITYRPAERVGRTGAHSTPKARHGERAAAVQVAPMPRPSETGERRPLSQPG